MAYRLHAMGVLVQVHPAKAAPRILSAYRRAGGVAGKAAKLLGVSETSLVRWTTRLRLREAVDRIRVKAGRRPSTTYNPNPKARGNRPRRRKTSLHQA